jgi:hypothetical protein
MSDAVIIIVLVLLLLSSVGAGIGFYFYKQRDTAAVPVASPSSESGGTAPSTKSGGSPAGSVTTGGGTASPSSGSGGTAPSGGGTPLPIDCVGEWKMTTDCVNGFYQKTYHITREPANNGNGCGIEDGETLPSDVSCGPRSVNCDGSFSQTTECINGKYQKVYNIKTQASGGGTPCQYTNGQKIASDVSCGPDPRDCIGSHVPPDLGCNATKCGTQGRMKRKYVITKQAEPGGKACGVKDGSINGVGSVCNAPAPPNCTP